MSNVAIKWPDLGAENTVPLTPEPRRFAQDESEAAYAKRVEEWERAGATKCPHCAGVIERLGRTPKPERVMAETEEEFALRHKVWADAFGRVKVTARLMDHDVVVGWRLKIRAVHIREEARCAERKMVRTHPLNFDTAEGLKEHADVCAEIVAEGLIRIVGLQLGARDLSTMTVAEVIAILRRRAVLETACMAVMAAQDVEGPEVLS